MLRRSNLWAHWKVVAHKAARLQSLVVLTILYYVLFVPLALLRRPFGVPLRRQGSRWHARRPAAHDLTSLRRQY